MLSINSPGYVQVKYDLQKVELQKLQYVIIYFLHYIVTFILGTSICTSNLH